MKRALWNGFLATVMFTTIFVGMGVWLPSLIDVGAVLAGGVLFTVMTLVAQRQALTGAARGH